MDLVYLGPRLSPPAEPHAGLQEPALGNALQQVVYWAAQAQGTPATLFWHSSPGGVKSPQLGEERPGYIAGRMVSVKLSAEDCSLRAGC